MREFRDILEESRWIEVSLDVCLLERDNFGRERVFNIEVERWLIVSLKSVEI